MHLEPTNPGDEIGVVIEQLRERAEKLGLYLNDAMVATPHSELAEEVGVTKTVKEAIDNGAEFVLIGSFAIGQVAWAKRTQDPVQDEFDDKARLMLPDPADEIKRRLEAGGDLFEDDDE